MNICDADHEEIVHDSYDCPLCDAQETINKHETTIEELEKERDTLKDEAEDVESRKNAHGGGP